MGTRAPIWVQAEAHIVLHEATADPAHLTQARALVARLAASLAKPRRERFLALSPLARDCAAAQASVGVGRP